MLLQKQKQSQGGIMKIFYDEKELIRLREYVDSLTIQILQLQQKKPENTQELANRIADLEVKMSKLWSLLTEQTPQNKDKLSKYGKMFGGKSKGLF